MHLGVTVELGGLERLGWEEGQAKGSKVRGHGPQAHLAQLSLHLTLCAYFELRPKV